MSATNSNGPSEKPPEKHLMPSGKNREIVVRDPVLYLRYLYHDNHPVVNAPFEVEMENGNIFKGTLDENGEVKIINLPSKPLKVRYGADTRPYQCADTTPNPDYKEKFSDADMEALVKKAMADNGLK